MLQETRHGQADGTTRAGRVKSDADDYRYFPEPDLVPVAPSREWVETIRASLPEMPAAKRRRLKKEWQLADDEMRDVVNAGALELIEATVLAGSSGQSARKWWMGELAAQPRIVRSPLRSCRYRRSRWPSCRAWWIPGG